MAAEARTQTAVQGKDELVWVVKPGGTDPTLLGCMTSFDEDLSGAQPDEIACRSGIENAPSGDVKPEVLSIEGITRRFASGQVAGNVTGDEIKRWVRAVTILTLKYGGKYAGDPITTVTGWFSDYSGKNPQEGKKTWSVKFNPLAAGTEATVS